MGVSKFFWQSRILQGLPPFLDHDDEGICVSIGKHSLIVSGWWD
jgi:hypothetical protein